MWIKKAIPILQQFETIVFDYDGVLSDTNQAKAEVFRSVFSQFSQEIQTYVYNHHLQNLGTSRHIKVPHYLSVALERPPSNQETQELFKQLETVMSDAMIKTPLSEGINNALELLKNKSLFVISGTPQDDLRVVMTAKKIDHYFKELLGSPQKKYDHLMQIKICYNLDFSKAIFVGDGIEDFSAAKAANILFLGV